MTLAAQRLLFATGVSGSRRHRAQFHDADGSCAGANPSTI